MKTYKIILIFVLFSIANNAWAYGGGGGSSKKACTKPRFSEFSPANNAQVVPGAGFSFMATGVVDPDSIKANVKGQDVELTLSPQNGGMLVSGKLPATITKDFARINVSAEGHNHCKGDGGWLVKVE